MQNFDFPGILARLKRTALILLWIRYLCQKCFRENRATTDEFGIPLHTETGNTSFRAAGSTRNPEKNLFVRNSVFLVW